MLLIPENDPLGQKPRLRNLFPQKLVVLSTASYAGMHASGQGCSGLFATTGETTLDEGGTEPVDDGLSINVQVSDNG